MQFSRGFWGLQVFLPYQFHMNKAEYNKHFDKIGKGKERVVKCKYCKQTMTSADTDRWRSHLTTNCKDAPRAVIDSCQKKRPAFVAFVEESSLPGSSAKSVASDQSAINMPSMSGINRWIDRLGPGEAETLDQLFAKIFKHLLLRIQIY